MYHNECICLERSLKNIYLENGEWGENLFDIWLCDSSVMTASIAN
ncbi:MAG: hypothetical protein RMX65_024810 [Nostoc sp. DedQUE01]